MRKTRTWAACSGLLFLLTLTAASARADSLRSDDMVVKLNNSEGHPNLFFREAIQAELPDLFAEFFEGNNGLHLGLLKNGGQGVEFETNSGKHLGFSIASTNGGNKFGLFKGPASPGSGATIPNPEPTAVLLLGTGLVAAGAYARKRFRKSGRAAK